MPPPVISFAEKLGKLAALWSPRVIAESNGHQLKLAKLEGEFVWHDHKGADEVFLVIEGAMGIEFRDGVVRLSAGEMCVVPKGVEHKPFAGEACYVLLIEPRGVVNTGDAGGALEAPNDLWI
jgi:mannose-6-phosphate isomerase-like protein (cupin superfamily)